MNTYKVKDLENPVHYCRLSLDSFEFPVINFLGAYNFILDVDFDKAFDNLNENNEVREVVFFNEPLLEFGTEYYNNGSHLSLLHNPNLGINFKVYRFSSENKEFSFNLAPPAVEGFSPVVDCPVGFDCVEVKNGKVGHTGGRIVEYYEVNMGKGALLYDNATASCLGNIPLMKGDRLLFVFSVSEHFVFSKRIEYCFFSRFYETSNPPYLLNSGLALSADWGQSYFEKNSFGFYKHYDFHCLKARIKQLERQIYLLKNFSAYDYFCYMGMNGKGLSELREEVNFLKGYARLDNGKNSNVEDMVFRFRSEFSGGFGSFVKVIAM